MELSMASLILKDALEVAVAARGKSTVLPALNKAVLLADEAAGTLTLVASDLSAVVRVVVPAAVTAGGVEIVDPRLLLDFVEKVGAGTGGVVKMEPVPLGKDDVAAATVARGCMDGVVAKCGRQRATLKGMDPASYPLDATTYGDKDGGPLAVLNAGALLDGLTATAFACDQKDDAAMRPALTGVLWTWHEGLALRLVGADGYRLALTYLPPGNDLEGRKDGWQDVIVRTDLLKALRKHLEGTVTVRPGAGWSNLRLDLESITVWLPLVEARYPDYTAIIPDLSNYTHALVDRGALLRALKVVRAFANNSRDRAVEVTLVPGVPAPAMGQVLLSAVAVEIGAARADLDAQVEGEKVTAGFQVQYMTAALEAMGGAEKVLLCLRTADRPGVLRTIPLNAGEPDHIHVLMPILVPGVGARR